MLKKTGRFSKVYGKRRKGQPPPFATRFFPAAPPEIPCFPSTYVDHRSSMLWQQSRPSHIESIPNPNPHNNLSQVSAFQPHIHRAVPFLFVLPCLPRLGFPVRFGFLLGFVSWLSVVQFIYSLLSGDGQCGENASQFRLGFGPLRVSR